MSEEMNNTINEALTETKTLINVLLFTDRNGNQIELCIQAYLNAFCISRYYSNISSLNCQCTHTPNFIDTFQPLCTLFTNFHNFKPK